MASNFPSSLDTFTNPSSTDAMDSVSVPHATQHSDLNDAVEALQVKVGVDSSADTSSLEYRIAQLEAAGSPIVKVAAFTSSGTWTVPAGVTYAVAHILGGGGGCHQSGTATTGGTSSVAFASGTVSGDGGPGLNLSADFTNLVITTAAGAANSGRGAHTHVENSGNNSITTYGQGQDASYVVAGASVTAGASIAVTVGAGGTGSASGGSGYVWIEYQES